MADTPPLGLGGPLADVPISEIRDELASRYGAVVILCLLDEENGEGMRASWDGGTFACMGMCQQFIHDQLKAKEDLPPPEGRDG